ncbi:hypothetical protein SO802_007980 [Lithocarpus litseifolius]|uniref:RNase H type-1 domain-containing protein n=1 Tax=Lithocarpus litseifolius TaxID=425828 RepID=A0AAW2DSU9_9ROSI
MDSPSSLHTGLKCMLLDESKCYSMGPRKGEGDCFRVIQALNDHGGCLTMYGHVIEETRSLGSCLEFCSFHHVKREGNKLAHSLVCIVVLSSDMDVWVEELLEDLDDVFQGDFAL